MGRLSYVAVAVGVLFIPISGCRKRVYLYVAVARKECTSFGTSIPRLDFSYVAVADGVLFCELATQCTP